MKKLITICFFLAVIFTVNAQQKFAVDSLNEIIGFKLGESYEKYKNEISNINESEYSEYKTKEIQIAFGDTIKRVLLKFDQKGTGKLTEIYFIYNPISKYKMDLLKSKVGKMSNEIVKKLDKNYIKTVDKEKGETITWTGNKIKFNFNLEKLLDKSWESLTNNGGYEVLGIVRTIQLISL